MPWASKPRWDKWKAKAVMGFVCCGAPEIVRGQDGVHRCTACKQYEQQPGDAETSYDPLSR
jgi:hypothetical protein